MKRHDATRLWRVFCHEQSDLENTGSYRVPFESVNDYCETCVAEIRIENVSKAFGIGDAVLNDVNLRIGEGEFFVVVGPSGSGKSTLLRILAGLERPSHGEIYFDDKRCTHLEPRQRDVAMVFQSYALYPHKNVFDNIAFGLRARRTAEKTVTRRVEEAAEMLGITRLLSRWPRELSGGERQRVAIGRAIVRRPVAFLLDEPLSNLDAALRLEMRGELARIHEQLGVTTVYITHDQIEAMTLGERIAVIRAGRIEQTDSPEKIYDEPCNRFVAEFIGSPPMNFLRGRWYENGREIGLETSGGRLPIVRDDGGGSSLEAGGRFVMGIRPEDVRLLKSTDQGAAPARLSHLEPLGHEGLVYLNLLGEQVIARTQEWRDFRDAEEVYVRIPLSRVHVFSEDDERVIRSRTRHSSQ